MSKRICFPTYEDWEVAFRSLDAESCKELILAVFDYGLRKELRELSPMAKFAMDMIKPLMDRDWEKYEKILARNKANSKNAGRPKKSTGIENNPLDLSGFENNPVGAKKIESEPIINNKIVNNEIVNKDNIESYDSLSEEKVSYNEIVSFYNNSMAGRNIPQCVKLTDKRKQAIKARLAEFGKDKVFEAITKAASSAFCNGSNDRNWKADFDFIFNTNKMASILEGKYDDKNGRYGNNGNSNEQSARKVGEKVLGDIFAEIEERQRLEGTAD
jgi:hypothetical protein